MMSASEKPAPAAGTRTWRVGLAAGALLGCSSMAIAQEERFYVDTAASVGVATNPFLQAGPTPTTASGTVEITPVYTMDRPLTTLRIVGNARVTGYTSRYRTNDSYAITGTGEHRLSERARLNAELGYINSIVGSTYDALVPVADPGPISELPTFVDDPALAGIGRRRSAYQGRGSFTQQIGLRDEISARVLASATRYANDDVGLDEFNYVNGGVSYARRVSEQFSISGNIDVGQVNYLGSRLGDATIVQPSVSVTRTLNSRWTMTASAGAAIVNLRGPVDDSTSTNFNGSISACRRDARVNACLSASRATVPSSVQGIRTQTGVAASLGYRVNPRDNWSFTASYSRANAPLLDSERGSVRSTAVDYALGSITYDRGFTPRLSGFVTGAVAKTFDDFVKRDANIEGRIGVRYRFGADR